MSINPERFELQRLRSQKTYNSLNVNIGPRVNNGISDLRGAERSRGCIAGNTLLAGQPLFDCEKGKYIR